MIGYAVGETLEQVKYRFGRMADRGIMPYPMVYNPQNRLLKQFQRWAVTGLYKHVPFEEYKYLEESKDEESAESAKAD